MRYLRHPSLALCALLVALLVPLAGRDSAGAVVASTVTRQGAQLLLDGQPYRFTGVNAYHLATDWSLNYGCGESTSTADLATFFASLRPNSVVRFWAFERQAFNKNTRQIDFSTIDRVVNAAAAANQKVILTIGNHWGDCDGPAKDTAWYQGGYRSVPSFAEGSMPVSYWDWLHQIVPRYADQAAVAMWEPLNEPEVACGSVSVLRSWFDAVGGEIKRLDPATPVSSGVIGGNQCGLAGYDYDTVHRSPGIDVGTYHDYGSPGVAMPTELTNRRNQLSAIGKPLFIGEAGIDGADGVTGCRTTPERATLFRQKMDAQFGAGIVGYMPWIWSQYGKGQCVNNFSAGDPLVALLHDYPLTVPTIVPAVPVPVPVPATTVPTVPDVSAGLAGWLPWKPLGGGLSAGPAAASWAPGRLDVFVRGTDDALYQRSLVSGAWSPWQRLGGVLSAAPAAVSSDAGRIDVFVRGSDNALYQRSFAGGAWGPWQGLGGVLSAAPAVSSWAPGRLDVFVRGTDDALHQRSFAGGAWAPWQRLGGVLSAAPAAVSSDVGRIDVFVRGSDNALHQRSLAAGAWAPWQRLGGVLSAAPAVSSWAPGRLDVFVRGSDDALHQRSMVSGAWAPWQGLGGVLSAAPAAVSSDVGRIDVFVRGSDNALYQRPHLLGA